MKIEPFGVEQWMNAWETKCALNLAETCVASLTLAELMQMAGTTQQMPADLAAMHMNLWRNSRIIALAWFGCGAV